MVDNRWAPTPSAAPAHRRMPWRNSPRSRRPPAGFIHLARPTLIANPPTGPGWWHEMKHDGFRIIARKQGDRVDVWSRHGAEFTDRFPNIAEAIRSLPVGRVLIDGEAVAFHSDGHSDFAALRTKTGGEQASLVAFDLLGLEGDDLRQASSGGAARGALATGRRSRRHPVQRSPAGRARDGVRPRLQAGLGGNRVEAHLKLLSQRDEPQLA